MPEILNLALLGSPRVLRDGQPLTAFATVKAQALLFYLAVTARAAAHRRDALAALLWGEMSDAQARQNLRTVLHDLRSLVGDHLHINRQTVAFDHASPYWLDVELLRRSLASTTAPVDLAARQATVDLYQGEFLSGFYVRQAPAFEAWVLEQREQLHTQVVETLFGLVRAYIQREEYTRALAANRRLLFLDPWSEPAHRQQMLILAQTGERSAALAQYETCRRILLAEFGVEPLPETTALYERIRTPSSAQRARGTEPTLAPERAPAGADGFAGDQRPTRPVGTTGTAEDTGVPAPMVAHNLPRPIALYGRQAELDRLRTWVLDEGCRLLGIFGIGGQGKTALAVASAHAVAAAARDQRPAGTAAPGFNYVLWRSLINAPPLDEVLQEWLAVLAGQAATTLPISRDQQISLLLEHLRRRRCLLILDNLESILESDERGGQYRPSYEGYGQLLRRVAEEQHRGCLLLTSRERPQDLIRLDEGAGAVRLLSLAGLPASAGRQMLRACGLAGEVADLGELVRHYSGNPLGLKLVAETIQSIFAGDIGLFLEAETLVFDDIRAVLDQQIERLPPLERELLIWLAIVREPVPFAVLRDLLGQPPASRPLLEAVRSLLRRSLLERDGASLGLQNVVLEYCSATLTETISRELIDGFGDNESPPVVSSFLNRFALLLAQSKEYVRASQTRLLLQPVAERLVKAFGSAGAARRLLHLLADLRATAPVSGYAAANLLHLLLHLEVDLRGADCSGLVFRQLSLRGVSLPAASFAGATLIDSSFTAPFGFIFTAAFSPDGRSIVAGTNEGAIYVWRSADQQLVRVIRGHRKTTGDLAFGQRLTAAGTPEFILASASADKTAGVWSLDASAAELFAIRLAHPQQQTVLAVSFHDSGRRLTAVDDQGEAFVWDVSAPNVTRLLHSFATLPTRRRLVAFSADGETMAVGTRAGTVQLWQVATGAAGISITVTTGTLNTIALRGDGCLLASGDKDGRIGLWRLPEGRLHQVIETQVSVYPALAFSPDGSLLASAHENRTIRLWSLDAQGRAQLRHTPLGHTHRIWSLHFGPPPAAGINVRVDGDRPANRQLLVSGSTDLSVRVWDTVTGDVLYMLHGHARAFGTLAIVRAPHQHAPTAGAAAGPDWLLATAGFDHQVHLWQGRGAQIAGQHRSLRGQRGPLNSVAFSEDGRMAAGAGIDTTVCLWDCQSGQLLQTLYGHTNEINCVAFQPGGALLASGDTDGIVLIWSIAGRKHVSDQTTGHVAAPAPLVRIAANARCVNKLAFSPDGRLLAVGGAESVVRLWDTGQPHVPELVEARKTVDDAHQQDSFSVAFSPDGATLASGGIRLISLWDMADDPEQQRDGAAPAPRVLHQHTSWVLALAFSPDGATLASGSVDCTVCLWEVASGALRAVLTGHTETINGVAFSPDGSTVFSCGYDGTIKAWDVQTSACVATLQLEGPYAGMNISGVSGITEAQRAALKALGAVEM